MHHQRHKVIRDPVYGYRRLDPVPREDETAEFYQSHYYELVRKGGRAPDLRRLMAVGDEADTERLWLRTTLYADILHVLNKHTVGRRVLDIGCGTGDLTSYLRQNGFDVVGIEPSSEAAAIVGSNGLTVYDSDLEQFVKHHELGGTNAFDAITLLNALEHVPNPVEILGLTKKILKPSGILCVRVPNDFSDMQLAAKQKINKDAWWIAIPDHINYFGFESLNTVLQYLGFDVIYSQGDFPMELFLLMGDDYVGNPDVGNKCHKKRVSFEMAVPGELRRNIYQAFAKVGIGRECLTFGMLKNP